MGDSLMITKIVASVILSFLARELWCWIPSLTNWLMQLTIRQCFPNEMKDRISEEWKRLLADTPGNIWKSIRAIDLCRGAFVFKIQEIADKYPREKWSSYYRLWCFCLHMFGWTSIRSPKQFHAFLATFLYVDPSSLSSVKSLPAKEIERLGVESLQASLQFSWPQFELPKLDGPQYGHKDGYIDDQVVLKVLGQLFFTRLTIEIGNPLISQSKIDALAKLQKEGRVVCNLKELESSMSQD